jgi:hypothetical protein
MIHITLLFQIILITTLFTGCSPEQITSQTTNNADHSDIMDISTWDFDDETTEQIIPATRPTKSEDQYSIVVSTFTGDHHAESASAARQQLVTQYPAIGRNLVLRPRSRGSVLSYGNYQGYDDIQAKKDIKMLRSIPSTRGTPLFTQIMLMRFKAPRNMDDLHPYDLWSVRREFPKLVPIYTLEVAVWGDFGGGQFPQAKRRAAAEKYASDLRGRGFKAYFHHNDDVELSSVTVGLFGNSAVDAETGFYSHEVDAIRSRFPARLVNGQQVMEYYNPLKPELGSSVQIPCLAEVPID